MSSKKKTVYGITAFLSMVIFFWCALPLMMGIINIGMLLPMMFTVALAFYCLLSLKYPMEDIPWKKDQDAAYKAELEMARCYVKNQKRGMRVPIIFGVKKEKLEDFDDGYEIRSTAGMVFSREARVKIDKVVWIITAVAAICVIAVAIIMNTGYEKFDGKYNGQVIVTLGAKTDGDKPSLSLEKRLDATVKLMKEYPKAKCIVAGGQGGDEIMPESRVMAKYLEEKGIESSRIIEENKSTNTEENIRFAAEKAEENGMSPEFILVTDGYHQYRANKYAEKYGVKSVGYEVATSPGLWLSCQFREVFAFFKTL